MKACFEKVLYLTKEALWVSVGQRIAKLQAVKVGKNSAARPESNHRQLDHPSSLIDHNFLAIWLRLTVPV